MAELPPARRKSMQSPDIMGLPGRGGFCNRPPDPGPVGARCAARIAGDRHIDRDSGRHHDGPCHCRCGARQCGLAQLLRGVSDNHPFRTGIVAGDARNRARSGHAPGLHDDGISLACADNIRGPADLSVRRGAELHRRLL